MAGNANTPKIALIPLLFDKRQDVRNEALGAILKAIYGEVVKDEEGTGGQFQAPDPQQKEELQGALKGYLLKECVKGTSPSLPRMYVFMHPECPVPALAKNLRSSDWRERCAIAQNPSTPDNTLAVLAKDGNWVVRAAAQENQQIREGA